MTEKISGMPRRRRLLLSVVIILVMVLIPGLATGTLTVDGNYVVEDNIHHDFEYIGFMSQGTLDHPGGFTNEVDNALFLGFNPATEGTYNLSSPPLGRVAELLSTDEDIGYQGIGTFNHDGGINTITAGLYVGTTSTGRGAYVLERGSLSAANQYIGYAGTGTFIHTVADPYATNTITDSLYLGKTSTGQGTYELGTTGFVRGGATLEAVNEYIGDEGAGTFHHFSTFNTITGNLYVGNAASGTGTYNLGEPRFDDNPHLSATDEYIGRAGSGTFNHYDGTNALTGDLYLGRTVDGTGTYNLTDDTLSANKEFIGYNGSGTFTQTGGSNTVAAGFHVGRQANGQGTYELIGGTLSAAREFIGNEGTGTFTQTGGTNTVSETLTVAHQDGSSGVYNLEGGSLSAASEVIRGTFNQSGGTLTSGSLLVNGSPITFDDSFIQSAGSHTVTGDATIGMFGTYYLQGGSLEVGNLYANSGHFGIIIRGGGGGFQQSGGTNTLTGSLLLNSHSFYKLGGSASVLQVGQNLDVGDASVDFFDDPYGCLFTQNNGNATVTGDLYLGNNAGTLGLYELNGGSLSADKEFIGHSGNGTFTQTGGSNSVTDRFHLGRNPSGQGIYELNDGSLMARLEFIGNQGSGTFTQTGGENTVSDALTLAHQSGSSGVYNLEGGTLSAKNITLKTGGDFNQTGGTLDFSVFDQMGGIASFTDLYLGLNPDAASSYNLSADSLSADREFIGYGGTGVFTQSGGTNTLAERLVLTFQSGDRGEYHLNDGSLSAPIINLNTGGAFNQTGGSLDFSLFTQTGGTAAFTDLFLGRNPGTSSTYELSAGSLSATNEHIRGEFTHSGGSNTLTGALSLGDAEGSNGTYTLSDTGVLDVGGTLKVGGEANGYFTQSGGTLTSGSLIVNSVQTTFANSFTQSDGSHTVSEDVTIGYFGTYYLQGGSLGAGDEYVRSGHYGGVILRGAGSGFRQSGGTNTLTGSLFLNSQSFYKLKGSTSLLQVGQNLDVGDASTDVLGNPTGCLFSQINGTATVSGSLYLGNNTDTLGTYKLNGGSLSASQEILGDHGTGLFNQAGGNHTVTDTLVLARQPDGSGTYNLSGGSLTATNEAVGHSGEATFNQTKGDHSILGNLYLGRNSGSQGLFSLSGGTQTVTTLIMGENAGSRGTFNLSANGNLTSFNEFIGLAGRADFNQTGGTHSVASNLFLGLGLDSQATYNLEGGSLSAGTLQINPTGTFNLTGLGDTLTTTVTGNVVNTGTIKTTNADVTWDGTVTISGGGVYISDPSTQTFTDLIVAADGCVVASQDTFIIKNNFENRSTRHTAWDTDQALLHFATGPDDAKHDLYIPGLDLGPTNAGYNDNFAWGILNIAGQTVHLLDGNDTPGGALYVGEMQGLVFDPDDSLLITNIYGATGLNIYYDPALNDLGGLTYDFMEGGNLAPTPLPASALLLGSGILGLGLLGWRRKRG